MRVLIWSFSLIIIVLSLLWIWAFSFALKKEDDDMLTDWIGTVLTSVCLWVLVTRPIQIIIQSAMKYFKEKNSRSKKENKEDSFVTNNAASLLLNKTEKKGKSDNSHVIKVEMVTKNPMQQESSDLTVSQRKGNKTSSC